MANFLLLVLVFCGQVLAGFSTQKLPPPHYGEKISILSIDAGGIKGIIPATVLEYLDNALKLKDPKASLAHYFDVIAGASTGGIVTAMLTAPNTSDPTHPPAFAPWQIVQFYKENGPSIFNTSSPGNGPKYNASFLYNVTRELLQELRLNDTLTKVVIPTFDLKQLKPVIFSSYQLESETNLTYLNAKLSDICIGTSAAPFQLPPYKFWNDDVEFNMIDGGMAAGNPAVVAVSEVIKHEEHKEILLLSLGTGEKPVDTGKYDADVAAKWHDLDWLYSGALLDIVGRSGADMTLYNFGTVFPGLMPLSNYLRIQEYNMDPSLDSADNVTKENMDNLEKEGNELLQQKVKRMDLNTFIPYELDQTNAQALDSLAEKLYQERKLRLKRKSMKGGRPFTQPVRVPFRPNQAT